MNILIVNFEYPPLGGGGGVATRDIATELAKKHTVHVLTSNYKGLERRSDDNGVHVHRTFSIGRSELSTASLLSMITFTISAIWRGIFLCRLGSFDVINAQFVIPSGISSYVLAKLFRIPHVVSFIGGDIYDPTKGTSPHRHASLRFLIRRIAAQAAALTAISEDTKRRARELHGVTQPITVTHLGFRRSKKAAQDDIEFMLPANKLVVTSIGRLIARKRFDIFIEAAAQVQKNPILRNSFVFLIIGDGPLRGELESKVKELGLSEVVQFAGFVSDNEKHALLGESSMFVSSAEHEGFGIVFLEAMDAGLPIVATADGGQRDFLADHENALFVSPQDVRALAASIEKLLLDKELRGSMSANNRAKVESFSIERTTAAFEKVLASVV